jgi:hypothetical protein
MYFTCKRNDQSIAMMMCTVKLIEKKRTTCPDGKAGKPSTLQKLSYMLLGKQEQVVAPVPYKATSVS